MEDLRAAVRLDGPQDYRPGCRYKVGSTSGCATTAPLLLSSRRARRGQGTQARRARPHDRLRGDQGRRGDAGRRRGDALRDLARLRAPTAPLDPWQGIGLAQRLRARGVTVEEWSYCDKRYGAAAGALFGLLRDGLLDLYDHPALLDELATVRLRETSLPGVVRVDHEPGRHDDMVQALGFAVTALVERPGRPDDLRGKPEGVIRSAPIERSTTSSSPEPPSPIVPASASDPVVREARRSFAGRRVVIRLPTTRPRGAEPSTARVRRGAGLGPGWRRWAACKRQSIPSCCLAGAGSRVRSRPAKARCRGHASSGRTAWSTRIDLSGSASACRRVARAKRASTPTPADGRTAA